VFVFGGLLMLGQHAVPLNLPDDGKDLQCHAPTAGEHCSLAENVVHRLQKGFVLVQSIIFFGFAYSIHLENFPFL
jgi:hypothetical protein